MNGLEIIIDTKKYIYLKSIVYNGKAYVAYCDDKNTYINEYYKKDGNFVFNNIDTYTFNIVKDKLKL